MGEGEIGEIDATIEPSGDYFEPKNGIMGVYLNYTRTQDLFGNKYNLSPRKKIEGVMLGTDHAHRATEGDELSW